MNRFHERRCIRGLRHFKGVEASAMEEQELVAQDLTGGAQFTAEMMALTAF